MLPSLIRTRPIPLLPPPSPSQTPIAESPEDILSSSLSTIFPDDLQTSHGDPDTLVDYRSTRFGDLEFEVPDPQGEVERGKFAHCVWNAGVLMGEVVGGRADGDWGCGEGEEGGEEKEGRVATQRDEWGVRRFAEGRSWWLEQGEEEVWRVNGEKVLELGAGVGLAGIVSALAGAEEVMISDYPSPTIIETIKRNVARNVPPDLQPTVQVEPHQWGVFPSTSPLTTTGKEHYTVILAADTLWLAAEHVNLARSMLYFLSPAPKARVLVIAGFHTGRAKLAGFFEDVVPAEGLRVERIWEVDADGRRREWSGEKRNGEGVMERKRWVVCAVLRRESEDQRWWTS